ncbi:MAG: phosphoribosylglycinamide formyltransferase [Thermoplasmata archaeon]
MRRIRIGVLASGSGTNLQAIIDSCESGEIDGDVVVVISNVSDAGALERARKHGIPAFVFPHKGLTREQHESDIIQCLEQHKVDLVCLAGYLRMLTPVLINRYAGRMMNTHPALLPSFGGKGMHGLHVHQAVLDYGCKVSGCTIHFVTLDVDGGPIILQKAVPVLEGDTAETLQERVLKEEHKLYPRAVQLFAQGKLKIDGRRVRILET